jgi:hypothetical protein
MGCSTVGRRVLHPSTFFPRTQRRAGNAPNARPRNSSVHLPQHIGQNIALTLKRTAYLSAQQR